MDEREREDLALTGIEPKVAQGEGMLDARSDLLGGQVRSYLADGVARLESVVDWVGVLSFICFSLVPWCCGASLSVPFCGAGPAERDA